MFGYNTPEQIEAEAVLRTVDYQAGTWKKPESGT